MNKKVETINLKGKDYATVPARIKEFREDCPNGLIETRHEITGENVVFIARILKDKSKPESAEATGHAIGELGGDKAFEKLETVSIGRALAILGYMASGQVASAEEMEDFYEYQKQQAQESIDLINKCKTLDDLKECFLALPNKENPEVVKSTNKRKEELTK